MKPTLFIALCFQLNFNHDTRNITYSRDGEAVIWNSAHFDCNSQSEYNYQIHHLLSQLQTT